MSIQILDIFHRAIASTEHKICINKLNKILDDDLNKDSNILFDFILKACVDRLLVSSNTKCVTENGLSFVGKWLSSSSDHFLNLGIHHLLLRSQAADKNVRIRSCRNFS